VPHFLIVILSVIILTVVMLVVMAPRLYHRFIFLHKCVPFHFIFVKIAAVAIFKQKRGFSDKRRGFVVPRLLSDTLFCLRGKGPTSTPGCQRSLLSLPIFFNVTQVLISVAAEESYVPVTCIIKILGV
jgi:hypothetical protein